MRKIYALCYFVFLNTVYSQQANLSPDLITFPVSPEAARMATYGNVPVNLFSGQLNKSVELFNRKIGDFNLPINLNYNYAGNRLEENPSIVGLGWQLSVGGVVTREVRGYVDESPAGYFNPSVQSVLNNYFNHMNDSINQRINYNAARDLANGKYDSQADKYTLSVNGINFSFKVGIDGTPAFLSKHDYKLQIIRNTTQTQFIEGFILTDTNANKYYFETKEINEPHSGYDSFSDESFMSYTSSWQLSKIVTNNNAEIIFTYDSNAFTTSNYAANLHYQPQGFDIMGPEYAPPLLSYNQSVTVDYMTRKILKSISCANFNINFDYLKSNDYEVYTKIIIKDGNTKIIDYYDFIYAGMRNCLQKINKNNLFFYELDYYDSVSAFSSGYPHNQDEWGFDNGSNNINPIYINGSDQYYANRKPSFLHTRQGALKTIIYPTGGRTEIEYEQNKIENSDYEVHEPNVRLMYKFKSDNSPSAPAIKERVYTKTFAFPVVATLRHFISDKNFIDVSITPIDIGASADNFYCQLSDQTLPYYTLIPAYRTTCFKAIPAALPSFNHTALNDETCLNNDCTIAADSEGKFMITAGTYEFRFRTSYNQTNNVRAEIQLDFFDLDAATYVNNDFSEEIGGIRVKRTIDYPFEDNSFPITKNFEYAHGTKFNARQSLHYTVWSKETCCADYQAGNVLGAFSPNFRARVMDVSSRPFNLLMHSNIPVYYDYVKEYTTRNETFETQPLVCSGCTGIVPSNNNYDGTKTYSYLGGTYGRYTYTYPEGYKATTFAQPRSQYSSYPYVPVGADLSIGSLKKSCVYSSEVVNSENKILSEETNGWSNLGYVFYNPPSIVNNPNYPNSLKIAYKIKIIDGSSITLPWGLHDFFYFKVYKEFDNEQFILTKNTKETFHDLPVDKNMVITYDSHFKQKTITTTDSNNNTQTNELFYPYDFADATTASMVSKNFIAPVVQVVNKENGAVLDSYKFDFMSIPATNLFKPKAFYKSKASNALELRNLFDYDAKGNVISTKTVYPTGSSPGGAPLHNGPTTHIIWGYNKSQIIAKIACDPSLSIAQSVIDDLQSKSNADTTIATEATLLAALNNLRTTYPTAQISTYTYDPLIGVTTMTDPKGDQITYTYDSQNRLLWVKDKNGNKLSENEYHYKN
jgi:YD repeat-containing protein